LGLQQCSTTSGSLTFYTSCPETAILPISTFQVAEITGISHLSHSSSLLEISHNPMAQLPYHLCVEDEEAKVLRGQGIHPKSHSERQAV
jgi:hypothetical protein